MTFLAGLVAKLLEYLVGDLVAWATTKYAAYQAKKAIEKAAADSVKKLKDAKTGKDIDDAAKDTLGGV